MIGIKGEWERYLKIIAHRMETIVILVRDPADRSLPESDFYVVLEVPYSKEQLVVEPRAISQQYHSYLTDGKISSITQITNIL
jgi:hypothetical protein